MDYINLIKSTLPNEALLFDEPMSRHTTFKVGGPAEVMFLPRTENELCTAVKLCKECGIPLSVIGKGSNLLVKDSGIRGLVVKIGEGFSDIAVNGTRITVKAGATLAQAASAAYKNSLTGLEFASGIPGSVGGGCAMNAGAYGGELKDVLESVRILDMNTLEIDDIPADKLEMSYRTSLMLARGNVVLEAVFLLKKGNQAEIKAVMDDLNARRRDKQPLSYPSAGSTFKRPAGYFAGALIEQAGLKGFTIGGAQVSEKHAGFVINTGTATAQDVLDLISEVRRRVKEMSGVELEPEVRILG